MKKILFVLGFFVSIVHSYGQSLGWFWANSEGGTGDELSYNIVADSAGNTYVIGDFYSSSFSFGGTPLANTGAGDIFIAKYDPSGNVLWAKSAGGIDIDGGINIAIDKPGNIYITGFFQSPAITFGNIILHNDSVGYAEDFFIAKYDSDGNEIWARSAGNKLFADGYGISCDSAGNVFVAGSFYGNNMKFDSITLTNSGSFDLFVAKYDTSGAILWAKSGLASGDEEALGITSDGAGNAYATGYFNSPTIVFGSDTLTNSMPGKDEIFITKYAADGTVIWAKSLKGNDDDRGSAITTDVNGKITITGNYYSSNLNFGSTNLANIDSDYFDLFVARYDTSGNLLWAKTTGGSDDDICTAITTDKNGSIYLTGSFYSTFLHFDLDTLFNTNVNHTDIFVAKYDTMGNFLWGKSVGNLSDEEGTGIAVTENDNVYITGDFYSPTLNFGSHAIVNAGGSLSADFFIARLSSTIGIEEILKKNNCPFFIYPNPAHNQLAILFNPVNAGNNVITIYDMTGRIVLEKHFEEMAGSNKILIDVKNLKAGLYFVKSADAIAKVVIE